LNSQLYFNTLPSRWREERLVDISDLRTSNVDKKTHEGELPVLLCNYVDVYYHDKITADINFMPASASQAQIDKFNLRVGDVIITKDSESPDDIGIPALVTETNADLVCGYHLTVIRADNENIIGPYLFYCLSSRASAHQFYLASNGVTRYGLSTSGTKNIRVALPPLADQQKIADFLDRKTAQIDGLIEKKRALIAKLKEKRLAVITQAVTRGLNPNAPLKDSGIEWLGQVPEHWEVRRLKFNVSKVGSGVTPRGGGEAYVDTGVPLFRSQNIHFEGLRLEDVVFIDQETHDGMSNSQIDKGDVLLNITGASIGRCNYFDGSLLEANVNQHVCIIRPEDSIDTRFLHYVLWSDVGQSQIQLEQSGSGREGLNFVAIKNFTITLPKKDEQQAIVEYLEQSLTRLNKVFKNAESVMDRLTEYRTALITAAVTGQLKIS
jgi:type I restriction enzyme S subunit